MTAADVPALRAYIDEAERLARPASEAEMIVLLERLFLHYPAPVHSDAANAMRWLDWLDDFGDMPPDVLAAACREWRNGDNRFAPAPGQLKALVGGKDHWGKMRVAYLERAQAVLAILEGGCLDG